jgi:hypothetical protein
VLIGPPFPPGAAILWHMYQDLSATRHWTDFGQPLAISYSEIEAYYRLNRYRMTLNDLALLRMLDAEYRKAMADTPRSDDDDDWSDDDGR